MLKVFLVEDEFVVREGIMHNIDWLSHGYDFCGEASDGELALPMIEKLQPDILITDIKMPFMDGLTLSKLIKKEFPWIEIIILSGYEDFEYAKAGIKIGVAQYLTKPISGEELLREIGNLADKIEEKHREQEYKKKYKKDMEEMLLQERKNFFQYLVAGSRSMPELMEMADKLHISISSIWYNILLLNQKSLRHAQNEYSNSLIEIEQKLKNFSEDHHFLLFDRELEGKALLIKADSIEELEQVQNDYLNKMKVVLNQYDKIQYFVGIGKPVNRLRELPISFERACYAFAHRYLVKGSCIINSGELEREEYHHPEEFHISNVSPKQLNRARIKEFLKQGVRDETKYFVEEFFKNLGISTVKSYMFRQYIAMDVYFCVAEFLEELQLSGESINSFDVTSEVLQNVESTTQYVISIIDKTLEWREKSASNRYDDVVKQVMNYIEKNYWDAELSLNLLASHVNFSPNHMSMIFSQQTGQTLIKYLTDYRMNQAKELLRCTGKRSSEISLQVGYRDPHYFSYLFKKTQGITPTQYRSGMNPEGDR